MRPLPLARPIRPSWLLAGLAIVLLCPLLALAQNRRTTSGLVLETGARHAPCDALLFTPDGNELVAAGDDKVVRIWNVGKQTLASIPRILRWPIYREQRGGIFALALRPGRDARQLAIGGFGIKTGLVAVLDRRTGAIDHVLEKPTSFQVTWSIAWSPDGKYTVHGTELGELFRWEPATDAKSPTPFAGSGGRAANPVRLIAFLDDTRFLAVTRDGKVWERDVTSPASRPSAPMTSFAHTNLFRAAICPNSRWLVACGENVNSTEIELFDLRKLARGARDARTTFRIPQVAGLARFPTALGFDAKGEKLAIGMQEVRDLGKDDDDFARVTGGLVHVYSLTTPSPTRLTRSGLNVGYRVDNVAFRPGVPSQIATAGGPNHEVRLWDYQKETSPLAEIRSPGSCLWSVAMSADRKYLAWKEKLNDRPTSPNDRGAGPWRIFSLDRKSRRILPAVPPDFVPVEPLTQLDRWFVQTTSNGYIWRVVGPETDVELSDRTGLYLSRVNQIPRCYTFLKAQGTRPPRLAVGHQWGVSIYDLRKGEIRLSRLLVGHEGEVMAVAPSPDGKLLLTASRDQTIAAWSLEDWPEQRELGASFLRSEAGKLLVKKVDPGSPAWEAGLTDGDEILMVVSSDRDRPRGFVYDPENRGLARYGFRMEVAENCSTTEILRKLRDAQPAREYIFVWRHEGKEQIQLTTVRQRPLWRFFPTREDQGSDWVLWRWRDFYYDTTSPEPDRLLGWQVNPENLKQKPEFYPLARFRGPDERTARGEKLGFHNPDKVWKTVTLPFQDATKVLFPDIEPPQVSLSVVQQPTGTRDLQLRVRILPRGERPGQRLTRVALWLDDTRHDHPPRIDKGIVDAVFVIPRARLRQGVNEIVLSAFNAEGGRNEASVSVSFSDDTRPRADLHALCVGINDYSRVKNFDDVDPTKRDLRCALPDAEALAKVFEQHEGSRLFRKSHVVRIDQKKATAQEILTQLRNLGKSARADDWLILFLSGHGGARPTASSYEPGSFFYLCADSDVARPETLLRATQLSEVLARLPCRKLILIDACRSGAVVSNPVRDLTSQGARFLIFTACKPEQEALEPTKITGMNHGLFTQGLLHALGDPALMVGKSRQRTVTARALGESINLEIARLLPRLKQKENSQTPVFEPRTMPGIDVLCKP